MVKVVFEDRVNVQNDFLHNTEEVYTMELLFTSRLLIIVVLGQLWMDQLHCESL